MEKYVYDGNVSDKYNYASHRFLTVASCGIHVNVDHITKRKKGRSDYHLLYVESGEMICEIDGKDQSILSGGYVLYFPNQRQKYEQNGGICYWVHFSGSAAEELIADAGLRKKPWFPGDKVSTASIEAFEKMIYRYVTSGHSNDLALSAELISLLSTFRQSVSAPVDERLCSVITYLNKHFFEKLDIERCANMLCLSSGRFAHIFKESTGVSPYSYVLNLRMEKAAELLALSDIPITDISDKVGFDNSLYFSKAFKKRYGVAPTVFRKEKWQNIPRHVSSTGCD